MPLAAHAELDGDQLRIRAAWGDPDGAGALVRAQAASVVRTLAESEALGEQVAQQLKSQGAH